MSHRSPSPCCCSACWAERESANAPTTPTASAKSLEQLKAEIETLERTLRWERLETQRQRHQADEMLLAAEQAQRERADAVTRYTVAERELQQCRSSFHEAQNLIAAKRAK